MTLYHFCFVSSFVQAKKNDGRVHNIYLKLATTNKHVKSEIIQLTAICEDQTFEKQILPRGPICGEATKRHLFLKACGLLVKLKYYYRENKVCFPSEVIPYEEAKDVFNDFLLWIDGLKSKNGDKVRLISHGMHTFHAQVLVNNKTQKILKYNILKRSRNYNQILKNNF